MNLPKLARKTIEAHFQNKKFEPDEKIKEKFSDKRATFVTLTKNGQLRGCVGSLEAVRGLWEDVRENAINAAFHDTRFSPLTEDELEDVKIEVSVLSPAKKLEFKDEGDLLNKINNKMGIILKEGFYTSTFLPQVWEQIPDKVEFLEELSIKAGLDRDAWKGAEIWFYTVDVEEE